MPSEDGQPRVVPKRDVPLERVDNGVEGALISVKYQRAAATREMLPVCCNRSARKQGEPLNLSDVIDRGHDLNLLGHGTPLHSDDIFVPEAPSNAGRFCGSGRVHMARTVSA